MSDSNRTFLNPYLLVIIAAALWSTGGLFIKATSFDAFSVNMGRSFFAAVVVAAFTYKKGLKPDAIVWLNSFLYAATLSCYVYATKNTTAANAIFLQYTAPIYILILAPFLLSEKFRFGDIFTVAACLIGMSLFFFRPGAAQPTAPNIFEGNVAALASGLFFGLYFIFLRHRRSTHPNPAISVFYGNLIVVVIMLPFVIGSPPTNVSFADAGAILYLGIFQIGIAYIFFTNGLAGGVRTMDASIIGFIEPMLNPFWVFIILGETPGKWALLGGVIILFTVGIHTLRQYRATRPVLSA